MMESLDLPKHTLNVIGYSYWKLNSRETVKINDKSFQFHIKSIQLNMFCIYNMHAQLFSFGVCLLICFRF